MIAELALVGGLSAIGLTVADHENLFQQNPTKLWWWERPPFKAAPPAARISQQAIQVQRVSPAQELREAREGVIFADQMLNYVSKKFPSLAVSSKYSIGQPSQPQQYTLPYQPKTYP